MTVEQCKIFLRYLKERGLYNAFLSDSKLFPERRGYKSMKDWMMSISPTQAIMTMISWGSAKHYKYWAEEFRKYEKFYLELNVTFNKKDRYEIFRKIKKVARRLARQ